MPQHLNKIEVGPDDMKEAERIENDPMKMLLLVDLLFMDREKEDLPS